MPSLCAFYEHVLKKYFLIEDSTTDEHTQSQYIPPACGRLKTASLENHFLFINSRMCPDVSGKTLFIHRLVHTYPGVCVRILHK